MTSSGFVYAFFEQNSNNKVIVGVYQMSATSGDLAVVYSRFLGIVNGSADSYTSYGHISGAEYTFLTYKVTDKLRTFV